jgi:hypothetical protein
MIEVKIKIRRGDQHVTIAEMAEAVKLKKSTVRRRLYGLGIKPEFYVKGRNGGLEYSVGHYRASTLERLSKATYRRM